VFGLWLFAGERMQSVGYVGRLCFWWGWEGSAEVVACVWGLFRWARWVMVRSVHARSICTNPVLVPSVPRYFI